MPKKSASRPKLSLPKGRSAFAKKTIEGVNRVVLKSRRNSSIGRVERGSSQPAIPEMGHKKNTKSLKIGQDDLKRMLMERMQKRHISKKEIVSGTDGGIGPDCYAKTQRNFRKGTKRLFHNRSSGSKRRLHRKRRSM